MFGLCWLGGERARCRADGVPSAPCGPTVPSTLLSHRERRADRLLQGEHHFLYPSLSLSHTHREAASSFPISFFLPFPHLPFLFYHSFPPSFYTLNLFPFFRLTFVKYKFTYVKKKRKEKKKHLNIASFLFSFINLKRLSGHSEADPVVKCLFFFSDIRK